MVEAVGAVGAICGVGGEVEDALGECFGRLNNRGFWGEDAFSGGSKPTEGDAKGVGDPGGGLGVFVGGLPVGEGGSGGAVYGLLGPGLGVGPAGGAGLFEFDGGFAGGFMLGEGAIELGEDFVGRFDWEEGETLNITYLISSPWIKRANDIFGLLTV